MCRLPLVMFVFAAQLCVADEKPLWKPEVGESWRYQVTVTVQEETQLPKNIEGQKIEKLEGKTRAVYPQTMVYRGLQPVGEAEQGKEKPPVAHAFTVSNGQRLMETQFMLISDTAVEALGVQQAGKKLKPLSKPIPLIRSDWKGGEFFPLMMEYLQEGQKVRLVRKFRVIGWEELQTAAGKFRALHVQASGLNGKMELKRSYWFAPGTGFVKEVKKYYVGETVVLTQVRVLDKVGE